MIIFSWLHALCAYTRSLLLQSIPAWLIVLLLLLICFCWWMTHTHLVYRHALQRLPMTP